MRQHFQRVGQVLFQLFEQDPFRFLIVAGPDEVVSDFVDGLHPYLRERYIGAFNCLMEANAREIFEETKRIVTAWQQREQERYVDLVIEEASARDMAVVGLGKVIEAVQMRNVNALVVDDLLEAPGRYCFRCGALQPVESEVTTCLYCGAPTRYRVNIVPEVYAEAYRQNANIVVLTEQRLREHLQSYGGIGAILRYRVEAPETA